VIRLLIATTNPDKLREIRSILMPLPVELGSLRDLLPIPEPEETGTTFEENARIKGLYYAAALAGTEREGSYTVAEDSGLVIDALGGAPGVHSARFLRPDASYTERFAEIYRQLALRPNEPRSARFICAVAVVRAGALVYETRGTIEGRIAEAPRGTHGFGYDPIFYYPPYRCTLAETIEAAKLQVAHRGKAFRQVARWLENEM
jgi:XTP/dITP diphosphohydrolase